MKHFRKYDKYYVYVRLIIRVQIKLIEMKQTCSNSISFYGNSVKKISKKNKFFKQNFHGRYVSRIERVCFQLRLARVIENVE